MNMSRGEMYALALSKNWGDYQKLITGLQLRFQQQVSVLAHAWWKQTQELTATFNPNDGWEMRSTSVQPVKGESGKFEIHAAMQRKSGYSVRPSNDPDDMWGLGGPPEHLREYEYERKTLVVPSDFIEKATFRHDVLAP